MLRVALKGLLGHKLRFALTMAAVVLGVTFVSGTFVLTDSINSAFDDLFGDIYATADVYVTAEPNLEQGAAGPVETPGLPAALADELAEVDGVATVLPYVEGFAQLVGKDGEAIANTGAPTFGFSWTARTNAEGLRQGRGPQSSGEVVIDAATFQQEGFELGDTIEVITITGLHQFTIVGSAGVGDNDSLMGATFAAMTIEDAQRTMGREGEYAQIALVATEGLDDAELRDRVLPVVADDVRVQTAQERADTDTETVASFLGFLNTALLTFAGVALFVGSFIIANTFSIVVAQRSREFALLRAVGASTRQVRAAVMIEATIVGLFAGVLGLLLGVAFAGLLQSVMAAVGLELPPGNTAVEPRTIVASLTVGVGVTLLAAIVPARRASRVPPVEAMRGATEGAQQGLGKRTVTGVTVTLIGGVAILYGLSGAGPQPLAVVGLGAAMLMLGVSLAAPLVAGPVARVIGAIPSRFGVPGRLAQRNSVRDRRRTATTASALMIGLALVAFVAILAASIRASIGDALEEAFRADFIVATDTPGLRNLPSQAAEDLSQREELGAVAAVRLAPLRVDGQSSLAAAVSPDTVEQVMSLGDVEGDPATMEFGDVFISQETADARSLAVGDTVTATFPLRSDVELTVAGVFSSSDAISSDWLLPLDRYEEYVGDPLDAYVFVAAADGVSLDDARAAVEEVAADYPGAQVQDQAEYRESQEAQVNQLLGLISVLLLLSVIVAVLGIANTMALSVFERTREIGLLRAVGMDRPQARSMIAWESVIVAVFGAVLGLLVGAFLGWAVVRALENEGIRSFVLPTGQLVAGLVGAGFAGILAAIFPAWRAARLNVLEAVTTE